MIVGTGIDIVEIARIERLLEKQGDKFAKRILTEEELVGFMQSKKQASLLSKRFAAKEAALKALGTGLAKGVSWHDIHLGHDENGKPLVCFTGEAQRVFNQLNASASHISVSDEKKYAIAQVILES